MSARAQLERLLYILPVVARAGGARVDELARALNVDRETVLHDLEQATARAYYHPAGFVEEFTILIEGDVVRVHSPSDFQRPVRLSSREALALGLGLRALAAEADAARRPEILTFAARLERELAAPQPELQPRLQEAAPAMAVPDAAHDVVATHFDDDEMRGQLSDAIGARRVCRLTYLSPTAREPVAREIKPVRMVYASGHWYVAAFVDESNESRVYRLDRIMEFTATDRLFEPVSAAAIETAVRRSGEAFVARADAVVDVRVRYSSRIARWIREQHQDILAGKAGDVVLTHQVSDRDWLVRHILQYGGEAVVEDAPYRDMVARAARAMTVT